MKLFLLAIFDLRNGEIDYLFTLTRTGDQGSTHRSVLVNQLFGTWIPVKNLGLNHLVKPWCNVWRNDTMRR